MSHIQGFFARYDSSQAGDYFDFLNSIEQFHFLLGELNLLTNPHIRGFKNITFR